jgi:aldose 1-epimerase
MTAELKLECLRHGAYRLNLAPELGGIVTEFTSHDRDEPRRWMRVATPEALQRDAALASACYPLVPFSNRIAGGEFTYEGRKIVLPRDTRVPPHAIHGHGWRGVWQVSDRLESAVTLNYEHAEDSWPWRYRATQSFELNDDGLRIEMTLTNLSETTMPSGLGLHPHFPVTQGVRLKAAVAQAHLAGETLLPVAHSSDHAAIGAMGRGDPLLRGLDLCFEGWDGEAEILWPEESRGLRLSASGGLRHLVVFTPPGKDFFCVEPVSHCINAVNLEGTEWGATGLVHLAPQGVLTAWAAFQPFDL